ncbi:hypothetical protein Q4577_22870 [Marinovum sp. 2_MG-2023]|uniref:hypothetical protein n=1 Tax=unclassified Marinovum TaxID=2647166 RepID=UPI0026E33009|nr:MULTISPECIES: hypothetical protein [unclassified Marinovum]MDO6732861.1 hypothetical protein [Marinovum sp. 2_MG-2023]MDO6782139.1 hypothetical protein [Marinovum sp. 1_MG-2023]
MPPPTVTIPTTGTDPKSTNTKGVEAQINAALEVNHDNIEAHKARIDNPHSVTPAQIGAATAAQGEKADSALQPSVLDIGGTVSTDYEFAGMFGTFHVRGSATAGAGTHRASIQYRTSTDGGSTSTGWTYLLNASGLSASTEYNFAITVNETFPADTNWVELR